MSKRRQYAICLAAYLTGWVIAQNIYNRLSRAWLGGDDDAVAKWRTEMAVAIADELESRRASDSEHDNDDLRDALKWACEWIERHGVAPTEGDGETYEDYSGATRIAWPNEPECWS